MQLSQNMGQTCQKHWANTFAVVSPSRERKLIMTLYSTHPILMKWQNLACLLKWPGLMWNDLSREVTQQSGTRHFNQPWYLLWNAKDYLKAPHIGTEIKDDYHFLLTLVRPSMLLLNAYQVRHLSGVCVAIARQSLIGKDPGVYLLKMSPRSSVYLHKHQEHKRHVSEYATKTGVSFWQVFIIWTDNGFVHWQICASIS